MLLFCLKTKNKKKKQKKNKKKKAESKNLKVLKESRGKIIFFSKCTVCDSKKSRFVYETSGLLNNLKIKTTLSKIQLPGCILF